MYKNFCSECKCKKMTEELWILRRIFPSNNPLNIILQGETTVGRAKYNSIQCPSVLVSPYHFVITLNLCGDVSLRDLGSTNGTYINDKKLIKNEVNLFEGDIIGIGIEDGSNINYDDTAYLFKLIKLSAQMISLLGGSPSEKLLETSDSKIVGLKENRTTNSSTLKRFSDPIVTKLSTDVANKIKDDIKVITLSDSDNELDDTNNGFVETNQNTQPILATGITSQNSFNYLDETMHNYKRRFPCFDINETGGSSVSSVSFRTVPYEEIINAGIQEVPHQEINNLSFIGCKRQATTNLSDPPLKVLKLNIPGTRDMPGSKNISAFASDQAIPDSLRYGEIEKESESDTKGNFIKYSNRSKEENCIKKSTTVVENKKNENIVSEKTESNLIKIMPQKTDSNKDLDTNLLKTFIESLDKSIEHNVKLDNNLVNGGKVVNNCEVVIREEDFTCLSISNTIEENIILIESDDEMPHSQMFDDPNIVSEENDKEMIDDRLSDEDEYNMVMDVDNLDDDDESKEGEWFQKSSPQFIDKEDERQGSSIYKERSLEEEDMDSLLEKLDSELDKDSGVDWNKEEDYKGTKTNDFVETVKSYNEMDKDRPFDFNKDKDSGKSKSYEKNRDLLSSQGNRKLSNKCSHSFDNNVRTNILQITTMEVPETREEEDFVKAATMDISDTREKEDSVKAISTDVTESKEDKDSMQRTIGTREVVKPGENFNTKSRTSDDSYSDDVKQKIKSKTHEKRSSHVKHKKDIELKNKNKTKNEKELPQTTSNISEDDDKDDLIKYAAKLLKHLAGSEREKGSTVSTSVSEVNQTQEKIKKKAVPCKKAMFTDTLPHKPSRSSKVNQGTLSTKHSYKSIKNKNSSKKTLNPIKGSNKLGHLEIVLDKKRLVEIRKKKLRKLTEKNKLPVVQDIKSPKPSTTKSIKFTIKNRSDFLIDDLINEQKRGNYKHPNILTDYKIPHRTSTEQSDDYKKVKQDSNVTIFESSLDIVTQSNSTLEPSFKKPPTRKSSTEHNEKFQIQKTKIDLNKKCLDSTMDNLKPKSFKNNCVKPILKNYSNNVIIQKQCVNGEQIIQFENDENLVKTRFIPFLENVLDDTNNGFVETTQNTQPILVTGTNENDNVPVKKDALPPPNVVRKLQQQMNTSQNYFHYSDETIYDICNWNPLWFEEQKRFSTKKPPPASPMSLLECREEYVSYKDYRRTMYPLLLQELWSNLTIAWEHRRNTVYMIGIDNFRYNSPLQEFKVKNPTVLQEEQSNKLLHIHCHTLLGRDVFTNNIYPHFGDLVLVEFFQHLSGDNDEEPKYLHRKVIGYIYRATPKEITQCRTQVRPELFAKYPQCTTVLHIVLRVKQGKSLTVDETSFGRIWILKSIRADLQLFRALDKLQESPLLPQILSPNSNRFIQNGPMALPELVSYDNAPILNQAQEEAVLTTAKLCLEETDNERIHLIHGPPGTGKSQVIISLVMQLWMNLYQKTKERPRILLCAPSNGAIDELVLRLMEINTTLSGHNKFCLVRNGCTEATHPSVKCLTLNTLSEQYVKKSIEMLENFNYYEVEENKKIDENTIKKMHADAETKFLKGANIIATTLASCYNIQMEKAFSTDINSKSFICCIIDEATQASEPETLIPLLLRVNHLILVGDPKQLPPTVKSVLAKQNGLNKSLFTRHQMWWYREEKMWKIKNSLLHFLDTQYRMHPAIAEWPSEFFYSRSLLTDENVEPLRRSPLLPYVLLEHDYEQGEEGEMNPCETAVIKNIVWSIRNTDITKDYNIGIISPYNKQRLSLAKSFSDLTNTQVEIGTVDSFQGKEKDIIILLCVKTDGVGINFNLQRLNVALTRAKISLIICGNFTSLQRDKTWTSLYKNALDRNVIRIVSPFMNLFSEKENCFNMIRS